MKNLVLAIGLLIASLGSLQARKPDENKLIRYCSNFGSGVSYSFESCVNSNFDSVKRDLGAAIFFSCVNVGSEVDYGFTSCIESNFRQAERLLAGRVWLDTCRNYDRSTLDFSYVSCVNSNFREIDSALMGR